MGPGSAPTAEPPPESRFPQLRPEDRLAVMAWLDRARGSGVDDLQDLSSRPWGSIRAEHVIGVFRTGDVAASWLLVGHGGTWAVASWPTGAVSARYDTLAAALADLHALALSPHENRTMT
jgi:hypothetical protein